MSKASFPARLLLEFINEEADYPRTRLMVFAVLSGIANGMLLAIVNHGAGLVGEFSASGDIVFTVGGNGSGKSTLLKLLCGLYYPLRGSIAINGKNVDRDLYPDYRELFSIIFTDFHLFDRFYGIADVKESAVHTWLKKMGMSAKTQFRDGRFTNINLSTGQRKRLAYINAMLDDKQIYIFDELAADQDPEFRKHFYEVLLPELRAMGKTIIAVTHDDRYFETADRVLKMDEGQLVDGGIV